MKVFLFFSVFGLFNMAMADLEHCKVNAFAAYMNAAAKGNNSLAILEHIPCEKHENKKNPHLKIKCTISFNPKLEKLPVDVFFDSECNKGELDGVAFDSSSEKNDCSMRAFQAGVKFIKDDIKEYIGTPNCVAKNGTRRILCDLKFKTSESKDEVLTIPIDFNKNCDYGIFHYKNKAYEYDFIEDSRRPASKLKGRSTL